MGVGERVTDDVVRVDPARSRYWLSRRTSPVGDRDRSDEGRGRTALVTGASAGIGLAYTELLAAKGYDVVPVARRGERLERIANYLERTYGVAAQPLVADLGEEGAARGIADELAERGTRIDYLVNNAGYSLMGRYGETPWEDQERFLRVIGTGVLELTHALLPSMMEQRWGRIVNVTSVAGVMAGTPAMVLYSAGKSLVHKFTEGLAAECEPYGVHCTVSLPGATDTEIFEASGTSNYATTHPGMQLAMMSPIAVARQAYRACERRKRMVVHGRHHKAWAFVLLHSPRSLRYRLCAFFAEIDLDRPNAAQLQPAHR